MTEDEVEELEVTGGERRVREDATPEPPEQDPGIRPGVATTHPREYGEAVTLPPDTPLHEQLDYDTPEEMDEALSRLTEISKVREQERVPTMAEVLEEMGKAFYNLGASFGPGYTSGLNQDHPLKRPPMSLKSQIPALFLFGTKPVIILVLLSMVIGAVIALGLHAIF